MERTILNLKNVALFSSALVCLLFVNFLNAFIYFILCLVSLCKPMLTPILLLQHSSPHHGPRLYFAKILSSLNYKFERNDVTPSSPFPPFVSLATLLLSFAPRAHAPNPRQTPKILSSSNYKFERNNATPSSPFPPFVSLATLLLSFAPRAHAPNPRQTPKILSSSNYKLERNDATPSLPFPPFVSLVTLLLSFAPRAHAPKPRRTRVGAGSLMMWTTM